MKPSFTSVCCLVAMTLTIALGSSTAFAAQPIDPMDPFADSLSPAQAADKALAEAGLDDSRSGPSLGPVERITDAPYYYLWTPSHKQINDHFCGPASVQIIDDFWGNFETQARYAEYMGVTKEGTNFTLVDDALRRFTGVGYYYHAGMDSYADVYAHIQHALFVKHRPLVCDVRIYASTWDNYQRDHAGHIIPIEAFDWRTGRSTVRLNDPYNEADYPPGGETFGHRVYPRRQVAHGVLNSMRPDLIW